MLLMNQAAGEPATRTSARLLEMKLLPFIYLDVRLKGNKFEIKNQLRQRKVAA
jgi:hypothetical protein